VLLGRCSRLLLLWLPLLLLLLRLLRLRLLLPHLWRRGPLTLLGRC
jgi:hypothetical protein